MTCLFCAPIDSNRRKRCVTRRDLRGFTLAEIMVVIFMIAVLAAVASPAFIKVMRDTNLSRLNMQIAEVYRKAYIESAEQSTYLVRYNATATSKFELVKSTLDTATPSLVSPRRCNAIDWTNPAHTRQNVYFKGDLIPEFGTIGYLTNANEEKAKADVCYAQRRAFVRYDDGVFVEMQGAARVYVKNVQSKVMRRVLVPSFGLPRLIQ